MLSFLLLSPWITPKSNIWPFRSAKSGHPRAPEIQELIASAKNVDDFRGEKGQQVVLHGLLKGRIKRCFFAGLGPQNKINAESFRSFAGPAVKEAAGA